MAVAQELCKVAPPLKVFGVLQTQWAQQILKTGVELDLFSQLAKEPLTAAQLAAKIGCDVRATQLLADSLAALGFLICEGKSNADGKYKLTEDSRHYLVKDSDYFFGDYVLARDQVADAWKQLTAVIRSGKPIKEVNTDKGAEEFFPKLAAAIFPINFSTAQMLADLLKVKELAPRARVLDLASGSAVWSIPLAAANKNLQVDSLDFPPVLKMQKHFTGKHGVASQYKDLEGSWRDVKLDADSYDLIILGHILHSEGQKASEELIKACFAALKKGGRLVIAEYMKHEEKPGPEFASMFAVNMLLMTTEGCVFSFEQLADMTKRVGFQSVERPLLPHWDELSPIVVAHK